MTKPRDSSDTILSSATESTHPNRFKLEEQETHDEKKSTLPIIDSSIITETLPSIPYSIFNRRQKWMLVLLISTAGLFSPLSANIYFPAIPSISADLGVTIEAVNLTVTFYMIFQGVSPTFWGAICDVLGRRPVYLVTFSIYILACIGLAVTRVYWLLVLLRCIQAAGSASVIALGAGSIGDISAPKERGLYMAAFSLGPMLGPAIGPVFGGLLAEYAGWQSIFWFLTALAIVVYIVMIIALPETLRSIVGNGSIPAQGINRNLISMLRIRKHRKDVVDPAMMKEETKEIVQKTWKDVDFFGSFRLFGQKDVLLILTFNSIIYTLFYCVITSTSTSLKSTYNLTETSIGLCFLANGTGCLLASFLNGPRMNRDYRIVARQVEERKRVRELESGGIKEEGGQKEAKDLNDLSGFPIEQARLRSLPYFFVVSIASAIIYGWTLEKAIHLSVPLICQFFLGLTITTQFNLVTTLMVDLFPKKSASATAANNFYRCLMGAGGTAVIDPILSRLGPGWAFTMLSLITICFAPLMVIEWKYGMGFRAERAEKDRLKKEYLEGKLESKLESK